MLKELPHNIVISDFLADFRDIPRMRRTKDQKFVSMLLAQNLLVKNQITHKNQTKNQCVLTIDREMVEQYSLLMNWYVAQLYS